MKKIACLIAFAIIFILCPAVGTSAGAAEKTPVEHYDLFIGQSVTLTDVPAGEIQISDKKVISVSDEYRMTALAAGKASISVVTDDNETVPYCDVEVHVNEQLKGLSFNEYSFSEQPVGCGSFPITVPEFAGMRCEWSSGDAQIARVDANGVVTPVSAGVADIHVKVTDVYGGVYTYKIPIRLCDPRFQTKSANLARGYSMTLLLNHTLETPPVFSSSNPSVASVSGADGQSVSVYAKKTGKTTITAESGGIKITCRITVTDPELKEIYGFYQTKKSFAVKVTGTNSAAQKQWKSENEAIATVNKNGRVTTKKMGSTVITCQVDSKILFFYLAVSTKTAVKAMRYGYKKVGKNQYSQARRMSANYYDCSSYVYRCYRAVGKYLVRKTSWAPVAAEIGSYYVRKGRRVKPSGANYSESKLRPGDLICFGGKYARRNGRYKRIYHIAMYIGNGKTMESSSVYNNVVVRDRGVFMKRDIPVVVRP